MQQRDESLTVRIVYLHDRISRGLSSLWWSGMLGIPVAYLLNRGRSCGRQTGPCVHLRDTLCNLVSRSERVLLLYRKAPCDSRCRRPPYDCLPGGNLIAGAYRA